MSVLAVHANAARDTARSRVMLELSDGSVLDVTEDHPIWVIEGDALAERPQLKRECRTPMSNWMNWMASAVRSGGRRFDSTAGGRFLGVKSGKFRKRR